MKLCFVRACTARWVLGSFTLAICAAAAAVAGFAGLAEIDAAARWPSSGAPDHITIQLRGADGSSVTGKATLRVEGDLTTVAIRLDGGDDAGESYLASIQNGACGETAPLPAFPLADATTETITRTTVEISLADLLVRDHVISIQRAAIDLEAMLDPESIVACGRIETDDVAILPDDEEFITTWPLTGAGVSGDDNRHAIARAFSIVLGGSSVVCAGLAAVELRRGRRLFPV